MNRHCSGARLIPYNIKELNLLHNFDSILKEKLLSTLSYMSARTDHRHEFGIPFRRTKQMHAFFVPITQPCGITFLEPSRKSPMTRILKLPLLTFFFNDPYLLYIIFVDACPADFYRFLLLVKATLLYNASGLEGN